MTRRIQILGCAGLLLVASVARGDDCSMSGVPGQLFTPLATGAGLSLGPATHYDITPSFHAAYFVSGGKLYAINAETGVTIWGSVTGASCTGCSSGSTCCQTFSPASVVQRATIPLKLSDGSGPFVFIANEDGFLYKVDASNGINGGNIVGSYDARRTISGTLCTKDALKATPLVELQQFSSNNFNTAYAGHDLVIVGTAYDTSSMEGTCTSGGHTTNKILAIDANTMTFKWAYSTFAHDEYDDGCDIDYQVGGTGGTDIIYCASKLNAAQRTLVALETHNGTAPNFKFKNDVTAGDIVVRPFLRGAGATGRVYVATTNGEIKEYTAADGATAGLSANWTCPLICSGGCSVTKNIWAEFRNGLTSTILAVSSTDGSLQKVLDTSDTMGGGVVDRHVIFGDGAVVTEPTVDPHPTRNKIYVGLADGRLHQVSIVDLTDEAAIHLSGPSALMGDPALDTVSGSATINRATIGNGNGNVGRFCVPFLPGTFAVVSPGGNPQPSGQPPIVQVVGSPFSCATDQQCDDFYRLNEGQRGQQPYNPACARPTCDIATGVCFFSIEPNMVTGCTDSNACTGGPTGDHCFDGDCFGAATPTCGCPTAGQACALAGGTPGTCCAVTGGPVTCFDTARDTAHCGACNVACQIGQVCINGVCCRDCGTGRCVDTSSEELFCGGCGPPPPSCGGTCCVGQCVDTNLSPNCGGCGNQCSAVLGQTCGLDPLGNRWCCRNCGAGCVDNANDPQACGACVNCLATGMNGCCNGVCKDLKGDISNCGGCGQVCGRNEPDCCNSECVNVQNNAQNCAMCGRNCEAMGGNRCMNGECFCNQTSILCTPPLSCCSNGCFNLNTNVANCGTCGNNCTTQGADRCTNGACRCGTGQPCVPPLTCVSGTCR